MARLSRALMHASAARESLSKSIVNDQMRNSLVLSFVFAKHFRSGAFLPLRSGGKNVGSSAWLGGTDSTVIDVESLSSCNGLP